ncbi:Methyltransferase type 11 [Haloterrigena turkmenica DSM 5511]|uniref:Arsenite methyltransferase n=1 Tax=Haloterrigena turkmenica (strain ATCC 51198 / DSM 5511 / JCM 9101 / NCIMB 13204 / VKM B-1734 / 4k) TaxID=543526 RepID=D2RYU5_HALTV|nr:arsenite methyltransferase [Haloterrigena turkmenica]ADB61913.1 Methyltransferase type 11 [Haloterrigena turkmenica DSM 5511]
MTGNDTTTDDATDTPRDQRTHVRERYAEVASADGDCCDASTTDADCCDDPAADDDTETECCDTSETDSGCCDASNGEFDLEDDPSRALSLGYEPADLEAAPEESNLGLGCGNPVAISNLEAGETVLDLGSGGGFDCFLAAREVGPSGRVIGVDMTPEMLERARENAAEGEFENVEFRLGEIEHLPVADATVDTIVSNCVVNLSPDKGQVFAEAYRVLRPGGTLAISDLVATEPLPREIRENPDAVDACVGGAATIDELEPLLDDAGFVDGSIALEGEWTADLPVASARIEARKPV